jgi:hypothetical protein
LPSLSASKKIDKIFIIESDNEKRLERLALRDGLTAVQVKKIDALIDKYYVFGDYEKIFNDYKSMPCVDLSFMKM